jgi:TusE/DsrC/DsvC family sulfur relay protein
LGLWRCVMGTMEYSGMKINLDDEGYLVNFEDWNENVAQMLAKKEGLHDLTKERMEILKFMRDYYKKFNSFPILRAVCKNVHLPKDCGYEQFPDPIKAWKIAGLPKPTTEVFALIKHEL